MVPIFYMLYSVYYKEYFVLYLLQVMFALVTTTCAKKTDEYILTLKTHNNRALHINAHGRVTAEDISLARKYDSINQIIYLSISESKLIWNNCTNVSEYIFASTLRSYI